MKKRHYQSYKRIINFRVCKFDKGCGFAIGTGDAAKEKNRRTTRQSNKSRNRPTKWAHIRFRKSLQT